MDGASKFVRGDAIAGLLIIGINIVGGIIIGVAQKGMSFGDATHTFTLLTVGDGLVSQMPALIVSTAAGLMVSKAGVEGATDKALIGQLSFYPQALGMAAAVMGIVALLPGMPTIVVRRPRRRHRRARLVCRQAQGPRAPPRPPPTPSPPRPAPRKSRSPPPWRWTCCASNWAMACCR